MMNQTYQDIQYIYRMSRTNVRTGIRIAVIGQKGPLFVFEDEKDNRYYDWSVQPRQNIKISAQGQHRIARTGPPGHDKQDSMHLLDRTFS